MKKLAIVLTAVLMSLSLASPAFAVKVSDCPGHPMQDESMIKLIEELEEAQSKFENLTDSQKEQIYKLTDKLNSQMEKIVAKYVKFGVLSEDSVEILVDILNDVSQSAREEGRSFFSLIPSNGKGAEVDRQIQ